jgi:hypothetical protein
VAGLAATTGLMAVFASLTSTFLPNGVAWENLIVVLSFLSCTSFKLKI